MGGGIHVRRSGLAGDRISRVIDRPPCGNMKGNNNNNNNNKNKNIEELGVTCVGKGLERRMKGGVRE